MAPSDTDQEKVYRTGLNQSRQVRTILTLPEGKRIVDTSAEGSYISRKEARWMSENVERDVRGMLFAREEALRTYIESLLHENMSDVAADVVHLQKQIIVLRQRNYARTWRGRWERFTYQLRRMFSREPKFVRNAAGYLVPIIKTDAKWSGGSFGE